MAKVKPDAPDYLKMSLFAPGMSALHRAGLGGLTCTLKAMERQHAAGLLSDKKLPGPMNGKEYPWEITDDSVTLKFGEPEKAGEYLQRLFAFGFGIKDGLVYLPGQYPDPPPSLAVRAEMQLALTRTFVQGAKKNIQLEPPVPFMVDPEGDGALPIEIDYQRCKSYLHQGAWKALVDVKTGLLNPSSKEKLNYGSIYPGAIKRHDALAESDCKDSIKGTLMCLFFLIGSASAKLMGSGDGVLLVPEVIDLKEFLYDRPQMTPQSVREVRVGSSADAAFQLEVRLRARSLLLASAMPRCSAHRFALRTWTKPQKSRVNSVEVDLHDLTRCDEGSQSYEAKSLAQYETALAILPRGVRERKDGSTYWTDSDVRPFIADNLVCHRKWYSGFAELTKTREKRSLINHQRKELSTMANDPSMLQDEERVLINSVHQAMLGLGRQIREVYEDRLKLLYQKYDDEREKWGRAFASCMTLDQFRKKLADMFRRAGSNKELQLHWEQLLPLLTPTTWQRARDLAQFGLVSFQPPTSKTTSKETTDSN